MDESAVPLPGGAAPPPVASPSAAAASPTTLRRQSSPPPRGRRRRESGASAVAAPAVASPPPPAEEAPPPPPAEEAPPADDAPPTASGYGGEASGDQIPIGGFSDDDAGPVALPVAPPVAAPPVQEVIFEKKMKTGLVFKVNAKGEIIIESVQTVTTDQQGKKERTEALLIKRDREKKVTLIPGMRLIGVNGTNIESTSFDDVIPLPMERPLTLAFADETPEALGGGVIFAPETTIIGHAATDPGTDLEAGATDAALPLRPVPEYGTITYGNLSNSELVTLAREEGLFGSPEKENPELPEGLKFLGDEGVSGVSGTDLLDRIVHDHPGARGKLIKWLTGEGSEEYEYSPIVSATPPFSEEEHWNAQIEKNTMTIIGLVFDARRTRVAVNIPHRDHLIRNANKLRILNEELRSKIIQNQGEPREETEYEAWVRDYVEQYPEGTMPAKVPDQELLGQVSEEVESQGIREMLREKTFKDLQRYACEMYGAQMQGVRISESARTHIHSELRPDELDVSLKGILKDYNAGAGGYLPDYGPLNDEEAVRHVADRSGHGFLTHILVEKVFAIIKAEKETLRLGETSAVAYANLERLHHQRRVDWVARRVNTLPDEISIMEDNITEHQNKISILKEKLKVIARENKVPWEAMNRLQGPTRDKLAILRIRENMKIDRHQQLNMELEELQREQSHDGGDSVEPVGKRSSRQGAGGRHVLPGKVVYRHDRQGPFYGLDYYVYLARIIHDDTRGEDMGVIRELTDDQGFRTLNLKGKRTTPPGFNGATMALVKLENLLPIPTPQTMGQYNLDMKMGTPRQEGDYRSSHLARTPDDTSGAGGWIDHYAEGKNRHREDKSGEAAILQAQEDVLTSQKFLGGAPPDSDGDPHADDGGKRRGDPNTNVMIEALEKHGIFPEWGGAEKTWRSMRDSPNGQMLIRGAFHKLMDDQAAQKTPKFKARGYSTQRKELTVLLAREHNVLRRLTGQGVDLTEQISKIDGLQAQLDGMDK